MLDALLIDSVVRSIQTGSLYALMAVGLTLTFNVVRLPNFAHAEMITIGAYAALFVSMGVSTSIPVILLAAFLAAALAAALSHRLVFRPLERKGSSIYTLMLASFAVGMIFRYILFLIVDTYSLFDKRIQIPVEIWVRSTPLILTNLFFWAVPTSIVLVLLLTLLLRGTRLGREMRALAGNFDLARVMGIHVERVKLVTWFLAGGLAGVAGALWALQTSVNPTMGWLVILSVFAATFLGGMTSFVGTIAAAYIVSFSENTLMQLLNYFLGVDFSFKPAIPFILILVVLIFRPDGIAVIFGSRRKL
jgi:branched-subunit amino acid ABC-type transport system permease component